MRELEEDVFKLKIGTLRQQIGADIKPKRKGTQIFEFLFEFIE